MGTGVGTPSAGSRADSRTGYDTSKPLASFYETVRDVLLSPKWFFRGLPSPGGPDQPIWFAVVVGILTLPLILVREAFDPWVRVGEGPGIMGFLRDTVETSGVGVAVGLVSLFLLLSPLFILLGLYVNAALTHVLIRLFVPEHDGFEATLKIAAYGSALGLLTWIPVLGYLASFWGLYVTYQGYRELHRATWTRAFTIVAIQALLLAGFFLAPLSN